MKQIAKKEAIILKTSHLDTPLGPMIAIANEEGLYLLEFIDRNGLQSEIERLKFKTQSTIIPGSTKPIKSIEKELNLYFQGKLKTFNTPLLFLGSPFQEHVWQKLAEIPFGETQSYSQLAMAIERPNAFRAVARANSTNQLAIIIPCHRVINLDGQLGGYAAGVSRKKWLLHHEKYKKI